jgi:hypothetical protein
MRCKVALGSKVNLGDGGFSLGFYAVYAGSEENEKGIIYMTPWRKDQQDEQRTF